MGGMKPGSGDDLYGDEADEEAEAETDSGGDDVAGGGGLDDPDAGASAAAGAATGSGATSSAGGELPWIYARGSITDGRPKTVQLHLQEATLDAEREALRDVPIEGSVQKADLREAAYLVGLRNLDEVADVLRRWGYGER